MDQKTQILFNESAPIRAISEPLVGAMGPQGETGGVLNFADFYALMPPDNAATVAPGTDVKKIKNTIH